MKEQKSNDREARTLKQTLVKETLVAFAFQFVLWGLAYALQDFDEWLALLWISVTYTACEILLLIFLVCERIKRIEAVVTAASFVAGACIAYTLCRNQMYRFIFGLGLSVAAISLLVVTTIMFIIIVLASCAK